MNIMFFIILPITLWFLVSALYMFSCALFSFGNVKKSKEANFSYPKIAVFIPAFKEDSVILIAAKLAAKHAYLGEFVVYVIADQLKQKTIKELKEISLEVIEVKFDKSTKAKSLNFAMKEITNTFDVAVVLDADNVMKQDFLNQIARAYNEGNRAIQGHRTAMSMNTNFAYLDAISEEVNNQLYCKGPEFAGLSSRLVGSGMAFEYGLFKKLMLEIDAIGGFDKELELLIIQNGVRIKYLESAVVFDEKVSTAEVFGNQRTRWISAQYHFLYSKLQPAFSQLFKGNFDYFWKAYQLALPPRLLFPGALAIGYSLLLIFSENKILQFTWLAMMIVVVLTYSISIPKRFWNRRMIKCVFSLFRAFGITILALTKIRTANKKFIHTPHVGSEVDLK